MYIVGVKKTKKMEVMEYKKEVKKEKKVKKVISAIQEMLNCLGINDGETVSKISSEIRKNRKKLAVAANFVGA